jgi:Enoyl-(Acyl carrier protein) reductase
MSEAHIRPVLAGQKALVVGAANDQSIAYGCAKAFRTVGAELAITRLNERARAYVEPLAQELQAGITGGLDVSVPGQLEALFERIAREWGSLDILVHSIAFAPKEDLQGGLPSAAFGRPPGLPDTPGPNDVRDLAPLRETDQHHSIPSRTAAGRANAIRPLASAAHTEARSIGRAPVRDGPLSGRRNSDPTRAGRSAPAHRNRAGSGRPTRPQRIRVTLLVCGSHGRLPDRSSRQSYARSALNAAFGHAVISRDQFRTAAP